MAFPFDFRFIPSTLGDDGIPLDILILMTRAAKLVKKGVAAYAKKGA
jgi:inorganic pyrophosphatase